LAKLIVVIVVWFSTQFAGIAPVFVSPTCTPEELKALEVVIVELPITTDLSLMPAMFIVRLYKFFMTVTFSFPWKLNPVPAVQEASVLLARIVNGETVPANASVPTKAD